MSTSTIATETESSANYLRTANKLLREGNLAEAVDAYQQVIQLNPKSAVAYQNLGETLSLQGNLEAGSKYISSSNSTPDQTILPGLTII